MTAPETAPAATPRPATAPGREGRATSRSTVWALLLRDLTVLDKHLWEFLTSTITQPLLLVFVFTYMFPVIGQDVGGETGGAARFATLLMAGVVAQAMAFTGIFRVAVPLAREFEITHELEDRVLAPAPLGVLALQKIAFGAIQSLFAAMVVFPVAAFVPATPVYLEPDWPVLLTLVPLACYTSSAMGLTLCSVFDPEVVPVLAGTIALPLAFGGAIFYDWHSLGTLPWLQYLVLVNPLVYLAEGLRAALVVGVDHMSLAAVYGALAGFAGLFTVVGVRGFKRRVLA